VIGSAAAVVFDRASLTTQRSIGSVIAAAAAQEEQWRCRKHERQCMQSSLGHFIIPFMKFEIPKTKNNARSICFGSSVGQVG
jgi:hypothetical protein